MHTTRTLRPSVSSRLLHNASERLERRRLLAGVYDVTAYGAVPNDGLNDAPAIQAALNASRNTGGAGDTILFPEGIYDLPANDGTAVFRTRLPGRRYLGQGQAVLRRPTTYTYQNGPTLFAEGADARDIVVDGLTFDGTGVFFGPKDGFKPANITIVNSTFRNAPEGDDQASMVYFPGGASNCLVSNNLFTNIEAFAGVLAFSVENFEIVNNTFDRVKEAVQINNFTQYSPGVKVNNNRMTRVTRMGIEILKGGAGFTAFDGLEVKNNVMSDFAPLASGTYDWACFAISIIAEHATNTVVEGNKLFGKIVSNWVQYTQPVYGLEIATEGGTVRNNLIDSFGEPISVFENGLPVVFENNRVRGVYAPHFIPAGGIIWHGPGSAQIISHNGTPAIETALLLGADLIVRGTTGSDVVSLTPSSASVRVQSGVYNQTFSPTGGLVVFGDGGNDSLSIAAGLTAPATLVGSSGDDTLSGGGGNSTLTGNVGNDTLVFDDSANSPSAAYTLSSTSLARGGGPANIYSTIESIVFNPGNGTIVTTNAPRLAALNVAAGRSVSLSGSAALQVGALSIAVGGLLDVSTGSMVIEYAGSSASTLDAIRLQLQSGRLMTSSTSPGTHLGYADNAVLNKFRFAGRDVLASCVLLRPTVAGDTDLDGDVDVMDLGALATRWQTSHTWSGGDFNYDGLVNVADLGMLASKWQAVLGFADAPRAS